MHKRQTLWAFLLPSVLSLLVVGLAPLLYAVNMSVRRFNLARPADLGTFIGFQNYANVLSDITFWNSLQRTFVFLGLVLPLQLVFGLVIALLLNLPGQALLRTLTRTALVIPLATTPAVLGLIGRLLFNREAGIINYSLSLFGVSSVTWLGSPTNAFAAIAVMEIWQWTPLVALVFLAGLSAVPKEAEDAARLETNRSFHILRYVYLPYLLPGLTLILILRTADVLKLFDMVFTMTRGGPGAATELISLYVQRIGFRVFDQGVASAQAIFLLVICIVLSRLYIRLFYREATA